MHIEKVRLHQYRNYERLDIDLDPHLNIFIGNNAQGKTNVLESIFIAGFGNSFRTSRDKELVQMGQKHGQVRIQAAKQYGSVTIDVRMNDKGDKQIKVNGGTLNRRIDLLGTINVVIFSPEDLRLIKEGPAERRRFLDRELSHISPKYKGALIEYIRVMKQRNELLKQIQFRGDMRSMLPVWDEQLLKSGTELMLMRYSFIERLGKISSRIHSGITAEKETFALTYQPNISAPFPAEYDTIYMVFQDRLNQRIEQDIQRGFTASGPHRDDLGLFVNGVDIRSYGSQGQQRTAALSLRLSEIEIIREDIGEYPVLLLDDVMSELDAQRQNDLIQTLQDVQTIITITDLETIEPDYINRAKVFRIQNGQVFSETGPKQPFNQLSGQEVDA